ncbi:VOC family protein [Tianweitania sp. BSSL-BM11]|uniref:VOC family protein n=1 Tax=Tianweitania aestuarii TaxID=2814886 RepID=A0ABS5RUA9_9HYPH|nr:VOC family protein [Tianweitania aestuarii]MBS9719307.1 VOC family protein [Tianweitania aestuarii]
MSTFITSSSAPLRIGTVSLRVNDLAGISHFYQTVLGLQLIDQSDGIVQLGAGNRAFLELVGDTAAPRSAPTEAGLFHTAFLLPERADLGSWVYHLARNRFSFQGASDHAVSEALYLTDPEGNGIEVYVDRPSSQWPYHDGKLGMVTERLDLNNLMAAAQGREWQGAPAGSIIGHVHLQVGATAQADAFYADALGLDITARYPGASFFGSGGYHHHLAGNIWNSRNATRHTSGATGLRQVELLAADPATYDKTVAGLEAAGVALHPQTSGIRIEDPWGTSLSLRQKPI